MPVHAASLATLIGPMIGADVLWADGLLLDSDAGTEVVEHRFWSDRDRWRVERSDGLTMVRTPTGSVTRWRSRLLERGPATRPGSALFQQLLMPRHAMIWGRPGEDWRLTEQVVLRLEDGLATVVLASTEDERRGSLSLDPASGRIRQLETAGRRVELVELSEEQPEGDVGDLFDVS